MGFFEALIANIFISAIYVLLVVLCFWAMDLSMHTDLFTGCAIVTIICAPSVERHTRTSA